MDFKAIKSLIMYMDDLLFLLASDQNRPVYPNMKPVGCTVNKPYGINVRNCDNNKPILFEICNSFQDL